jgi:hypothetical protein
MAAKDLFHEAVRRGLEKDRRTITDDPLELEWEVKKSAPCNLQLLQEYP